MISNVSMLYTAEYIANVFWNQNIAQVSAITLIPYFKNQEYILCAYIDIANWCDTEAAYNFIQRLRVPEGEARLVHHDDEWWPVQINTHNAGQLDAGSYTTKFPQSYFVKEEPEDEAINLDEYTILLDSDFKEQFCEMMERELSDAEMNSMFISYLRKNAKFLEKRTSVNQMTLWEADGLLQGFMTDSEKAKNNALKPHPNVTLRAHQKAYVF
jgi:hypothetical protein